MDNGGQFHPRAANAWSIIYWIELSIFQARDLREKGLDIPLVECLSLFSSIPYDFFPMLLSPCIYKYKVTRLCKSWHFAQVEVLDWVFRAGLRYVCINITKNVKNQPVQTIFVPKYGKVNYKMQIFSWYFACNTSWIFYRLKLSRKYGLKGEVSCILGLN